MSLTPPDPAALAQLLLRKKDDEDYTRWVGLAASGLAGSSRPQLKGFQ